MKTTQNHYSGCRYPVEIISHAVWLCFRFAMSFRDVEEILAARGIVVGVASLRRVLREYVTHYHIERNHQGVGNRLLMPVDMVRSANDPIHCRECLGGMLKFYYREAA